jgi:tRNA(fMet)-specific endonuclease VapC
VSGETSGLLDTSVVIDIEKAAPQLPGRSFISAITLAELTIGPYAAINFEERTARQQRLQVVESRFESLPFDAAVARAYGNLCAAAAAAGRKAHRRRAFDYMIAATARATGLPLYTRNPSDFEGLEDLITIVAVR